MESEAETCVFRGSDGVSETRGWPPPQNQAKSALLTPERRFGPRLQLQSQARLSKSTTPSKRNLPSEPLHRCGTVWLFRHLRL